MGVIFILQHHGFSEHDRWKRISFLPDAWPSSAKTEHHSGSFNWEPSLFLLKRTRSWHWLLTTEAVKQNACSDYASLILRQASNMLKNKHPRSKIMQTSYHKQPFSCHPSGLVSDSLHPIRPVCHKGDTHPVSSFSVQEPPVKVKGNPRPNHFNASTSTSRKWTAAISIIIIY